MTENEIATIVGDACYQIHSTLGPGLLESAYQAILVRELRIRGLSVQSEVYLPVQWKGEELSVSYRIDILVEQKVIIELKSVEKLALVHYKQVLTYLRLTGLHLGLVVNFGEALIKDGIKRVVNQLPEPGVGRDS